MAFFYPKTCSNCLFSSGWILLLVSAHAHSLVLKPPIRTASSGVKEKTRPHCLAKSHLPGRDLSPCHPLNLRRHGHPAGRVQIPVQRRPKGLVSQSLVLKVEKHLNRVQFWHLVWPCCARLNRPAKRMEEFPLEGKSFGKHWTCLLTPNHKLRQTCYSPTSQMRNRICSACWTLCVEQQRMKPPRPSLNPLYLLDPTPQTCPPSHLQYHWTPLHNHPSTCHKDTIVLLSQLTLLSQPTCLSQVPTIFQPPATHSLFSVRYLLWVWPPTGGAWPVGRVPPSSSNRSSISTLLDSPAPTTLAQPAQVSTDEACDPFSDLLTMVTTPTVMTTPPKKKVENLRRRWETFD